MHSVLWTVIFIEVQFSLKESSSDSGGRISYFYFHGNLNGNRLWLLSLCFSRAGFPFAIGPMWAGMSTLWSYTFLPTGNSSLVTVNPLVTWLDLFLSEQVKKKLPTIIGVKTSLLWDPGIALVWSLKSWFGDSGSGPCKGTGPFHRGNLIEEQGNW